jgi:hypothetical protein
MQRRQKREMLFHRVERRLVVKGLHVVKDLSHQLELVVPLRLRHRDSGPIEKKQTHRRECDPLETAVSININ